MANIIKTKGIVLWTMPFKESSLIASVFTEKYGKIKVLAKGIRRPKSRICGALEIFNLDDIIFYKREFKEIYNLSDAGVTDYFAEIRNHPTKVNAAMILCEFFNKTLPAEDPDIQLFTLFLNFLRKLQDIDELRIKPLTFCYLLKAFSGTGVRPHLDDCVRCHEPLKWDNKKIDFSIGAGGVVCNKHYDDTVVFLSTNTYKILRQIYNNKDVEMGRASVDEIEKFIPDYLYYHLNNLVLHSLKHLK